MSTPIRIVAAATRPRAGIGFSLIELIMVLMIISTIAAIAVPRYANSLHRYHVNAAAQRIAADLALVQAHARATSSAQTISFNPAGNRYQLPSDPVLSKLQPGGSVLLANEPYCATLVSAAFGAANSVSFNGFGVPNSGGTIVVRAGDNTRTIVLNASTGAVEVQ